MFVITGATGNIGRVIVKRLLEAGEEVRVIGRSAERLQPLVDKGAQPWVGSVEDAEFLTRAFTGAEAVFTIIPPNLQAENMQAYANRVGEAIATAIGNSGVSHVVNLSSQGAHRSGNVGAVAGLHDQEQRLNAIEGVNVLQLRPTYFMENLLSAVPMIKSMGINGSALKGNLPIPMIASKDVAEVAAQELLAHEFSGSTVLDLLGERDVTMNEVTAIFGKRIGQEYIPYVQFPYAEAEQNLLEWGMSADVAHQLVELDRSINEERLIGGERTGDSTTPTSIEEFARTFAAAYNRP